MEETASFMGVMAVGFVLGLMFAVGMERCAKPTACEANATRQAELAHATEQKACLQACGDSASCQASCSVKAEAAAAFQRTTVLAQCKSSE